MIDHDYIDPKLRMIAGIALIKLSNCGDDLG